jgi:hypothetical protein
MQKITAARTGAGSPDGNNGPTILNRIYRDSLMEWAEGKTKARESAPPKPAVEDNATSKIGRAARSEWAGLFLLLALTFAGGEAREDLHLPLPDAVLGLMLLAAVTLLVVRFHKRS